MKLGDSLDGLGSDLILHREGTDYATVGNHDNLYRVSKGMHDYLTEKGVPHIWRVDTNGHDTGVMSRARTLGETSGPPAEKA